MARPGRAGPRGAAPAPELPAAHAAAAAAHPGLGARPCAAGRSQGASERACMLHFYWPRARGCAHWPGRLLAAVLGCGQGGAASCFRTAPGCVRHARAEALRRRGRALQRCLHARIRRRAAGGAAGRGCGQAHPWGTEQV